MCDLRKLNYLNANSSPAQKVMIYILQNETMCVQYKPVTNLTPVDHLKNFYSSLQFLGVVEQPVMESCHTVPSGLTHKHMFKPCTVQSSPFRSAVWFEPILS